MSEKKTADLFTVFNTLIHPSKSANNLSQGIDCLLQEVLLKLEKPNAPHFYEKLCLALAQSAKQKLLRVFHKKLGLSVISY